MHFCFRDNKCPVLIPLPFIRSETNVVSSVKQQKPTYTVPYIYSNRTSNKGKLLQDSGKQNTTSAAVIMFDPMNIPDLGHGRTLTGNFAVEWKSTNSSNKQDTLNADSKIISHSHSVPVILPSAPVQGTISSHKPGQINDKKKVALYIFLDEEIFSTVPVGFYCGTIP